MRGSGQKQGACCVWVETDSLSKKRKKLSKNRHPRQLKSDELLRFFSDELKLPAPKYGSYEQNLTPQYFRLPSSDSEPIPSPELSRYLETEAPVATQWEVWAIDCYRLTPVIKLLNEIHFFCLYNVAEVQLGADLLFWYHYSQSFKSIIFKDQYIPAFKYRELQPKKGKRKKTAPDFEIYPVWEIISPTYEANLSQDLDYMPISCTSGFSQADVPLELYDKETLLRHFSECLLNEIVTETPMAASFEKKFADSRLLTGCLHSPYSHSPLTDEAAFREYQQWQTWKQKLVGAQEDSAFYLGFQLQEASDKYPDDWSVKFLISLKQDPSLKLELNDYWSLSSKQQK